MTEFMLDGAGQARLSLYFERIGEVLGHPNRKASFADYALGLWGEGDRKSMEPIAARSCGDPAAVAARHQRIQYFVSESDWNDHAVRETAAEYALNTMKEREPITHWIIDDTGFLKQGTESVGVKRQYTGSAGKIANCQIGVSLSITTATEHVPIDFELYLPREWTEPERRKKARIPPEVGFKPKPDLALDMIRRAVGQGVPRAMVLADTAYGNSASFRHQVRALGLTYAVAVSSTTKVRRINTFGDPAGEPLTVAEYAEQITKRGGRCGGFRRFRWREGTKGTLSARFAKHRVRPLADDELAESEQETLWLLMEWENGKSAPTKFYFVSLPKCTSTTALIHHVKQRWRTERIYEDMKGELGLDHFEGRLFRGWHHHVSVVLCCYAFIVAERVQRFPPSARGTRHADEIRCAA